MMRFSDRVAVISGAARGIGRAIALRLAREGAAIAILDRDAAAAAATAHELEALGCRALVACLDVASESDVITAVDQTLARWERIDVLVNSAGTAQHVLPVIDLPVEEWERMLNVNLKGTFLLCKHAGRHMAARQRGRIINISSINGLGGAPLVAAYNAAKWAVIGFSKTLANELASCNVTVNIVCPGPTDTEFHQLAMPERAQSLGITEAEVRERIRSSIPLGRWAIPEDIANAVAFLASDDASFITGEVLTVSGGLTGVVGVMPRRRT